MKRVIIILILLFQKNMFSIDLKKPVISKSTFSNLDISEIEQVLRFTNQERKKLLNYLNVRLNKISDKSESILDDLDNIAEYTQLFGTNGRNLATLSNQVQLIILTKIIHDSIKIEDEEEYSQRVIKYIRSLK